MAFRRRQENARRAAEPRQSGFPQFLFLWLDCDREGENICFEVLAVTEPMLTPNDLGGYHGNVFRARFSSLAPADLQRAMDSL